MKINIAIDGYSACGKSTTAKAVAKILGYSYLDSGAMYRAVTLYLLNNEVDLSSENAIIESLPKIDIGFALDEEGRSLTKLNEAVVEERIRQMDVSERVSYVSTIREVRHAMVDMQRNLAKNKGIVMDGRDIGSVVIPDAELKIFMTADPMVRAKRRQLELKAKGEIVDVNKIKENLLKRDEIDSNREHSPLIRADDAHVIDTSSITLQEQNEMVLNLAKEIIENAG